MNYLVTTTDSSPESSRAQGNATSTGGGSRALVQNDSPGSSSHMTSESTTSQSRHGQQGQANGAANSRQTSRKRKKTFTREDRAMHSVIERHRRESFNQLLSQLASNIPNESLIKKASKGIIVRASIAHHAEQRRRALTASVEIRKLLAERADLLREVNTMRQKAHTGPRTLDRKEEEARQQDRQDVFDVETESFAEQQASSSTAATTNNDRVVLDSTAADEDVVEMQIRSFLQLQQQQQQPETSVHESYCAANHHLNASFTSPTPSQIARFMENIDNSDLLHLLPT